MPGCQMGWSQKSEMQSGAINKQVNKGHKSQSAVSTNEQSHTFVTADSGYSDPIENICDQPLLQDESVTVGQMCEEHRFKILDYCKLQV